MKKIIVSILTVFTITCSAQSDVDEIQKSLQNYIEGSSYNNPEMIQEAFYENADLFLSKEGQEIWIVTPKEYAELFKNRKKGEFNGREGKVLSVDIINTIALAKAEIRLPSRNLYFIDIFLLKKLSGKWKIISKAATQLE